MVLGIGCVFIFEEVFECFVVVGQCFDYINGGGFVSYFDWCGCRDCIFFNDFDIGVGYVLVVEFFVGCGVVIIFYVGDFQWYEVECDCVFWNGGVCFVGVGGRRNVGGVILY